MPKLFEQGNQAAKNRGPNKTTTRVKDAIVGFLEANVDKIQASFDQLKPVDKLNFIADILPYAAPKLSSVQSEVNGKLEGEIRISLNLDGNKIRQALGSELPKGDS